MKKIFIITYLIIFPTFAHAAFSNGYTYCREMTMAAGTGGVATTTTIGFPLVATSTIADLKSTTYGGKVEVVTADKPLDIIFTDSADCATPGTQLNHYFESYASTTGAFVAWTKATDVSSTTAKTVTMYYGNSSATDTSNQNGVWSTMGIVGKYDLSEGYSTSADFYKDGTANANHGQLSDANGNTAASNGQVNGAITISDAPDNIDMGDIPIYDAWNDFTVSLWIDSTDTAAVIEYLVGKYHATTNQRGWAIAKSSEATPRIRILLSLLGTDANTVAAFNATDLLNGADNLITYTRRGSTVTAYLNGEVKTTDTFAGTIYDNTAVVSIGGWPGTSNALSGQYDDVRMYTQGLTAADVKTIYNNTHSSSLFWTIGSEETSSASFPAFTGIRLSKPSSYLFNSNGIVAHWTFNGPQMLSNVGDLSNNGNSLFLSGFTSTTTVPGKSGQALQFDGVDDYAEKNSQIISEYPFTLSAWVKTADTTGSGIILELNDKDVSTVFYGIRIASNVDTTKAGMYARNTTYDEIQSTTSITDGRWHHITGVFTSATDRKLYVDGVEESTDTSSVTYSAAVDRVSVGRNGDSTPAGYLNGAVDDVRVYNRALSPSEVKALANAGVSKVNVAQQKNSSGLIGYWTFNGPDLLRNVKDVSGNNSTGYLQNFSSTTTAPGKNGQALSFNGVNNYVDFNNTSATDELKPSLPVTVSAWVKISNQGVSGSIFSSNDVATYAGYTLMYLSTGEVFVSYGDNTGTGSSGRQSKTGTTNITDDKWHHVVAVIRGASDMDIYVDGVNDGGTYTDSGGSMVYTTAPSRIGLHSVPVTDSYTKGSIDDVRVYNRALTAAEAVSLYRFGGGR